MTEALPVDALSAQMLRSAGLAAGHTQPKPRPKLKLKAKHHKAKKVKKHKRPPVKPGRPGGLTIPIFSLPASLFPAAPAAAIPPAPAAPAPPLPPPPPPVGQLPAWPPLMPPPSAGQGSAPGGVTLNADPVAHLIRRTTFGSTPALVADVHARGVAGWLDQQLSPASIDDSACDAVLAAKFPMLSMDALTARAHMGPYSWDAMEQVTRGSLLRAVASKRQVFEAVVDVWNQRFNITCPSDKVWSTRHVHEQLIRARALGKFSDLLAAVETSPAMLLYLDNAGSDATSDGGVNENLGREMLELHTVGAKAGYSENDVRNSAYAISGLSVIDDDSDIFEYKPGYRYVGPITVMGWSNPNPDVYGGLPVALAYFNYLAHHPATAASVCAALAQRFVADTPPPSLMAKLIAAYQTYDTAIVPVLRTLFASDEFWTSWGQKLRRPMEFVTATLRTLGVAPTVDDNDDAWASWCWALGGMGMSPLGWDPPSGYPDVAPAWLSTNATLGRWNASVAAVGNWYKGGTAVPAADWTTLLAGTRPATFGAFVDGLSQRLIGQTLSATERSALFTYCGKREADVPGNNDLQYRTDDLAQLILSSPAWSLR